MVFSSHLFLFYFLPLVLLLNYSIPFRFLTLMLTIVSYLFYGWANPKWALIMLLSTAVDYCCGLALVHFSGASLKQSDLPQLSKDQPRNRAQRIVLWTSIATNLSLLGFFKYHDFAVENINALLAGLGFGGTSFEALHMALPVGISFYTFQSMSYAIDVYRGDARPLKNPIDFACFVALFPHQLAGPIIRYWSIAEQIRSRTLTIEKFCRGAAFVSLGLGKKVLLANPMAHIADSVFAASALNWYDAWFGTVALAFQFYLDFSAYSDIAVGLALMLGFLFTKNFDDPYRSSNITEYRRRWHISLTAWLRDYLFIPLGGTRLGEVRSAFNIMTVMLIIGLWHGASWNFVMWGGIHGLMLLFERFGRRRGWYDKWPDGLRRGLSFFVFSTALVFFRTESFPAAAQFWKAMFTLTARPEAATLLEGLVYTRYHVAMFLVCLGIIWKAPQVWDFTQRITLWKATICLATLALSVLLMWTQTSNPFLYYQF